MRGAGYAASAGAFTVLAVTLSPWFAAGAAACALLALGAFVRDRRARNGH